MRCPVRGSAAEQERAAHPYDWPKLKPKAIEPGDILSGGAGDKALWLSDRPCDALWDGCDSQTAQRTGPSVDGQKREHLPTGSQVSDAIRPFPFSIMVLRVADDYDGKRGRQDSKVASQKSVLSTLFGLSAKRWGRSFQMTPPGFTGRHVPTLTPPWGATKGKCTETASYLISSANI
jgi:hypothetical protein